MTKKEEFKEHVIKQCVEGSLTVKSAAKKLGFSERYIKKLKARYKELGVSSMLHGNCGRQPKTTLDITLKQQILNIRKLPKFDTANTLHFKEILEDDYNIYVSYYFQSFPPQLLTFNLIFIKNSRQINLSRVLETIVLNYLKQSFVMLNY